MEGAEPSSPSLTDFLPSVTLSMRIADEYKCCSPYGWCGKTPAHCACDTCVDYGVKIAPPQLWRDDLRCGAEFPLPNGLPAQCDPFNADESKCCSPYGWCGKTPAHCACDTCVDYGVKIAPPQLWRDDGRCGAEFPLPNGLPAQCDPFNADEYKCCSPYGWCGKTPAHCACDTCVDYGVKIAPPQLWRDDGRCGAEFPLPNGLPAQCDPFNADESKCCSPYGWCGKTPAHCACDTCVDYGVKIAPPQLWRDDGRCGAEFPLPNGLPAQCDPFNADESKCCSPYGWCGKTPAHCACDTCVDYGVKIAPPQLWRDDGRCGAEFPLPNGLPAQCDPFNADEYKCCSPYGWCGKTPAHCACDKCVDYAINYGN